MKLTIEVPDNPTGADVVRIARETALRFRNEMAIPDRASDSGGAVAGAVAIVCGTVAALFACEDSDGHRDIMLRAMGRAGTEAIRIIKGEAPTAFTTTGVMARA